MNLLEFSPKLLALQQLLVDSGIGVEDAEENNVSQHRVLIFAQLKSVLDIIQQDLFKRHMPSVTHLRFY
jgi:TATA-binding protein-associated factor